MDKLPAGSAWYCVRTVFRFRRASTATYEERLTRWLATGFSAAIALADAEAHEYADSLDH